MQSDYFACESCGALGKLLHGLCNECLPKYHEADPPQINKQGEPGERPGNPDLAFILWAFGSDG